MPVLILGSGRCGTSMVARMLNICGLNIGTKDDMTGADSSNPKGYWEHMGLSEINEEILEHYGGSTVVPPELPQGWEFEVWLNPLFDRAKKLTSKLASAGNEWGWKDPKAGYALPFWKRVVAGLKVVVCFRNPLDVVKSYDEFYHNQGSLLYQQGGFQGYAIWQSSYKSIIEATLPEERIFTQYETYFPDYSQPLADVLKFLGLPELEKCSPVDRKLIAFHDPTLRHHSTRLEETLKNQSVPRSVKRLFVEMIAGQSNDKLLAGEPSSLLSLSTAVEQTGLVGSLLNCDYATAIKIERLNLKLLARNRELESILASRSHRIASGVCSLLIWKDSMFKKIAAIATGDIQPTAAASDQQSQKMKLVHKI